jgi:hypothetical protein
VRASDQTSKPYGRRSQSIIQDASPTDSMTLPPFDFLRRYQLACLLPLGANRGGPSRFAHDQDSISQVRLRLGIDEETLNRLEAGIREPVSPVYRQPRRLAAS